MATPQPPAAKTSPAELFISGNRDAALVQLMTNNSDSTWERVKEARDEEKKDCEKQLQTVRESKDEVIANHVSERKDLKNQLAAIAEKERAKEAKEELEKQREAKRIKITLILLIVPLAGLLIAIGALRKSPQLSFSISIACLLLILVLAGYIMWVRDIKEGLVILVLFGGIGLFLFANGTYTSKDLYGFYLKALAKQADVEQKSDSTEHHIPPVKTDTTKHDSSFHRN